MKVFVNRKYGSPDVLQLEEVEKPTPADNEILVKVRAISVNPWDWHSMRGKPAFARLALGLRGPKIHVLGADVAGQVEVVGEDVKRFQPGDEVFGDLADFGGGSFAEYVCNSEEAFVVKPTGTTFEEAAAVPLAALTALQGLRDKGQIQSGQKVLVNGASGGVGSFAVQIAKSFDTEVTGVCSTGNIEMVHSIGADRVIDYTQDDFTRNGLHYDLVFDAVGNHSVSAIKRALNPGGICAVIGFSSVGRMMQTVLLGPFMLLGSRKKMGLMVAKMKQEDLVSIKELVEAGKVIPVIDRRYSFDEIPEAVRYLEEGHARGKVVVTM
ncbi:MAG: NAD(P)-dependent alcohol dehydrogenase [Dehalococcoidia bacterium]|nr:NAD(P)-dependent alcohol dehydrogenase [Dehalococcoidia bacterium]